VGRVRNSQSLRPRGGWIKVERVWRKDDVLAIAGWAGKKHLQRPPSAENAANFFRSSARAVQTA